MSLVKLTQQLIKIPSYVDSDSNETGLANFIESYIKRLNLNLKITEQRVKKDRYNLIVGDIYNSKLLFLAHMDTVATTIEDWKIKPFSGKIIGNKIYGLGASDMKGSIASLLSALTKIRDVKDLCILFDVDEEGNFEGMKKFIKEAPFIKSKLVVSLEPTDLSIANRHKGIVEIDFRICGESAHAASEGGKNAIILAVESIKKLKEKIAKITHPGLGKSSFNLAYINGGTLIDSIIERRPNLVPDRADLTLDIRPSEKKLKAKYILNLLKEELKKKKCSMSNIKIIHDYSSLFTSGSSIKMFTNIIKNVAGKCRFENLDAYGEAQMLNEKYGAKVIYFGPGSIKQAHKPDEFVEINKLKKAENVIKETIKYYCT